MAQKLLNNPLSPTIELATSTINCIGSTLMASGDTLKTRKKDIFPVEMHAMPSSHNPMIDFDPIGEFYHQPSTKYSSNLKTKLLTEASPINVKGKKILFFDMDNCLYPQSSGISEAMRQRILLFCATVHNMSEEEANFLAKKYHTDYGLAIKGLLLHHPGTDPSQYDQFVDGGIDIQNALLHHSPAQMIGLFEKLRASSIENIWILTNAGSSHSLRTLSFLFGVQFLKSGIDANAPSPCPWFDGIIYCDYSVPNFICKPQLSLFLAVTKMIPSPKDHYPVLIDDSLSNVYGALRCGWGAVLVSENAPTIEVFLENGGKYMHFVDEKDCVFLVIRTVYDIVNVINFV